MLNRFAVFAGSFVDMDFELEGDVPTVGQIVTFSCTGVAGVGKVVSLTTGSLTGEPTVEVKPFDTWGEEAEDFRDSEGVFMNARCIKQALSR